MNANYDYEPIVEYEVVARAWYEKIAPTAFASFSAKGLHHQLLHLARQATSLLLAETFSTQEARDIGSALAGLHYVQGDAFGASIEILTAVWLKSIPAQKMVALQPRMSALLGTIANGYFDRATATILKEQASIRNSYVSTLLALHEDLKRQQIKLRESNRQLQAQIDVRAQIEAALRVSEEQFRVLFEDSPIALMLLDASDLYRYLVRLHESGIEDLNGYFQQHLDELSNWLQSIELIAINQEVVELVGAAEKQTLLQGSDRLLPLVGVQFLIDMATKMAQNKTSDEGLLSTRMLDGRKIESLYRWTVPPAYENNYARVILSLMEITAQRAAEEQLKLTAERLQTLHEIESGILAAESPRSIANIALEHLVRIIPCQSAAVSLFDLPCAQNILLAGYNTSIAIDSKIPIADWGAIDILERHEPVLIDDLTTVSQPTPAIELAIKNGKRSLLSVPLLARDELVGAISLTFERANAFSAEDVEIAQQIGDSVAVALHNAQLLETEQNARREADTLREIAANMNASLDRDEILGLILTQLESVLPYDSASILLYRENALVMAAHQGMELHAAEISGVVDLLPPNIKRLLREQQPLIILDTQDDLDWIVFPGREFVRCWLGVPLKVKEGLIGLLLLAHAQANIYSQQDAVTAMAFANHAAVAIENARLYSDTQLYAERMEQLVEARTKDLSALYDITAVSSQYLDLQTSLEKVIEKISAAMDCKLVTIQILDEAGTTLRLAAHQGISPAMVDYMQALSVDDMFTEKILQGDEPYIIKEAQTDSRLSEATVGVPATYSVGTPIRAKGEAVGVLGTAMFGQQPPTREEIALLTSIADQIGVTIENAVLRQRAEQSAVVEERKRLARDLHDSATQSLFSLTLFAAAARELVRSGQLARAEEYLDDIGTTANQTHKEMRLLLYELRPSMLAKEGLVGALRQRTQAVEDRSGIQSRITADIPPDLPAAVDEALHQVATEALNNILRHSGADLIKIEIRMKEAAIIMKVSDNGQGFETDSAEGSAGMGLANMRQRIEALNGSLEYNSVLGEGSKIIASIPVDVQATGHHQNKKPDLSQDPS